MNQQLSVFSFLDQHILPSEPILVGVSGGPDSMCLLDLVTRWKNPHIHVAHVNHRWRPESDEEARAVEAFTRDRKLHFHTTVLDPKQFTGNLELACRNARMAFFQKVAQEIQARVLLLAHHADDQAETVFKRILEGASLCNLAGIRPVVQFGSLTCFRPLLGWNKQAILEYLSERGIAFFSDPTNTDRRFLRARLRVELFPALRNSFGKAFDKNLCLLAKQADRLTHFLDEQVAPYINQALSCQMGLCFEDLACHEVVVHHLIKTISGHDLVSREQIETLVQAIVEKKSPVSVCGHEKCYFVDRGRLFVIHKDNIARFSASFEPLVLAPGTQEAGPWVVKVEKQIKTRANHWRDFFKAEAVAVLPEGEYVILPQVHAMRRKFFEKKSTKILSRYFNEGKIPLFLRSCAPVIVDLQGFVVEDFLTDTSVAGAETVWSISLTLKD